jgi:Ca2+/H+ antiporter, TMEM165/GDT1 family
VAFALTALAAVLACGLEMLEAVAIVLAVALERRPRDAVLGGAAGVVAALALGFTLGPVLIARIAEAPLHLVIGVALALFGLEWLRKGIQRLAGQRSRSSSYEEFVEERAELSGLGEGPRAGADWIARTVAFKGVLLEGVEVVLIVTALAGQSGGVAPALIGATTAALAVTALGFALHRPLRRLPETELKYVVGLVLTTFGTFLGAEGLGVHWPLGDAALLILLGGWLVVSQLLILALTVGARGGDVREEAA